ncbi:MAG: anti-sigma F factor [Bacillota bacterium]|nr:anti-sigma F factor [Bacillota bacterium]
MTKGNWLQLKFPSRPENVAVARLAAAALASQLDFTLPEMEEIKVAVSEAVSNCVLHAYPQGEGPVEMEMRVGEEGLFITVTDKGQGILDVNRAREPTFTTSRDPDHLGLGFTFMENFMDDLEVESAPGRGTQVRMRKKPADVYSKAAGEEPS